MSCYLLAATLCGVGIFASRPIPQVERDKMGTMRLYNRGLTALKFAPITGGFITTLSPSKYGDVWLPADDYLAKSEDKYEIKYRNWLGFNHRMMLSPVECVSKDSSSDNIRY
jgi:hypothetical protein